MASRTRNFKCPNCRESFHIKRYNAHWVRFMPPRFCPMCGERGWCEDLKLAVRHVETCEWRLEHSGTLYDKWRCSKCGYLFVEPRCDQGYNDMDPNFCPSCGRKVVTA